MRNPLHKASTGHHRSMPDNHRMSSSRKRARHGAKFQGQNNHVPQNPFYHHHTKTTATLSDNHHHSHHTPQLISDDRMNHYQSQYRVAVHHLLPDARSMGRQLNQLNIVWKAILATMLMVNPMGSIVILVSWNYAERLSHSCGRLLPEKINFLIPFEKFILWQWKYFQREQIVGRSALIVIGFLLQPKTRERFHGYIKHQWNLRHRAAQDEYDNYGVLI